MTLALKDPSWSTIWPATRAADARSSRPDFRLGELTYLAQRLVRRGSSREATLERTKRLTATLRREIGVAGQVTLRHRLRSAGLVVLAFGFWLLDALCLFVVFSALGVEMGLGKLLVAYALAQLVATLPFMPFGGLGAAERVLVSLFALLDTSATVTVIPLLGYRLFNYWMPILLAAVFYPTLRSGAKQAQARKVQ